MSTMENDCVTTLCPEMLKRAKKELGENDYLRESSITAIRQWLKMQPHLQSACAGNYSKLSKLRAGHLIYLYKISFFKCY